MASIHEIAPDVFRISLYVPEINLQFNHFLVRDDEPLLFHTGLRQMFPAMHEAVSRLIHLPKLRWISFSHFESDECGALNDWLNVAPNAVPVAGVVGVLVNLNDFSLRPPRALAADESLITGKYRFRYIPTPQLPHGWDAGVCFEETHRTLLCSDLFHHDGDVEPITSTDILGRVRQSISEYQRGPLANYMPYTANTGRMLRSLAEFNPVTLALMHGSSYAGDGRKALEDLDVVMREVLTGEESLRAAG